MAAGVLAILFGIICGNLGAVLLRGFNLGLWWNSVLGALGAAIVVFGPRLFDAGFAPGWMLTLPAAGLAGLVLMVLVGGLVALRHRR